MQVLIITLITWLIAGAEAWLAYPILNTPLILCPIVGALCGDLTTGVIAGATLQLIFLGVMQIGGTLPADAALGSIIGTYIAIKTGQSVEIAVTLAVPAAIVGSSLTFLGYFIRTLFAPLTEKLVNSGNERGIEIEQVCLAWLPELPKYIVCYAVLAFGTGVAEQLVNSMPDVLIGALDFSTALLPAVGIALLLKVMWNKSVAIFFFMGVVLSLYLGLGTLPVALIGVITAVLVVFYGKDKEAAAAVAEEEGGLFND